MRTPRGLTATCAGLLASVLLLSGPASAETPEVIGGGRLGSTGYVVDSAAPKLPTGLASTSWLVADLDSGEVLAARNPHGKFLPASTLKTLTALTLIPQLDPTRIIRPTLDDVNVEGSKVGLVPNLNYSIPELFTAMLVVSGNDAANALATANGGVAKTLAEMNAEADRLQARDTHAATVSGLDGPGQTSSAYDLALIARAGMAIPSFRQYVATKRSSIRGRGASRIAISTHNKLIFNYDGALGIKNGYTVAARATFVGAATRDGRTLVVSMMKTTPRNWPEAAALLDWGFAASKAGVTPVGRLVDPLDGPSQAGETTPEPTTAAVRPSTAKLPDPSRDLPLLPLAVMGSGIAALGAGLLRFRRRPRSRYDLKLPL